MRVETRVADYSNLASSSLYALHVGRAGTVPGCGYGAEHSLLPSLAEVALGSTTLEIVGPGYGANLRVLANNVEDLTEIEIDGVLAGRLQRRSGSQVRVIHGDGTATGLPDERFSSVVCFTVLHHVPTESLQDKLFGETPGLCNPGVSSPVATESAVRSSG